MAWPRIKNSRSSELPAARSIDGAAGVQVGSSNVQFNCFTVNRVRSDSDDRPLEPPRGSVNFRHTGHAFISYIREDSDNDKL
jgi:hypothetical protein